MGREVVLTVPELSEDGFDPKGPASVCLTGTPRQCYTAPKNFGRDPALKIVEIEKGVPALLFSAASGGVSGFSVHFALLQPGAGSELHDLFLGTVSVSNQSEHAFWTVPTISDAKIFVTADYVWGPDESHYEKHRYIISSYVLASVSLLEGKYYYLDDRYMTVCGYDSETQHILTAEKSEIIARLTRVKQSRH